MKKRYVLSVLTLLFLFLGILPVQAKTEEIKTESVTLTEDNRYNPEYYRKPEVRYPAANTRTYSVDRSAQTLEEYIVAALENFETEIDVLAYRIPRAEGGSRYLQILNNHPGLFYVKSEIKWTHSSQDFVWKYTVTYISTKEEFSQQKKKFEIAADQAVAQVEPSMSDLEKALVVHDYLVQNCEYDYERYSANRVPAVSHTAYGGLVEKMAVCDGYGKAYAYIMKDKLGIPCELVSSEKMNHAWNLIQIDGEWYHVDATWDDPAWDSIGRVVHKNFLLSDDAIRDAEHKHHDWVTTRTASSTLYDTEYWSQVDSAFCYNQGTWYYSQYQEDSRKTSLLKRNELLSGTVENVYLESAAWNNDNNSYMYLTKANKVIYFNTPTAIKRLDADGTITEVYKPTIPSGQVIFGFTVRGDQLYYALQTNANLQSKQQILAYTLPELSLLEMEGITAENVNTVYDGTAKTVSVEGTQSGDIVQYALGYGVFQEEQPELIGAGTYQVLYKVQRTGYQTLYGEVQVEIEKAVPEYTLPAGLMGYSGNPLASVYLRSGFSWMDSSIKMYREGKHKYLAKYMPNDQKNYQIVTDIEVEVTVKCPKHRYTSEITKEPTETENGEKTFTCSVCGDSYVEEIAIDLPEIQGIQVENVKIVYNGSAQTITVEGIQAGDIVQYAGEDKVYGENQPEMINAGVYQVFYKVTRTGCQPFYGTAQVEIEKAVPEYTIPVDLKGDSGTTLESVKLPEGFVWQTEPQTKLYQEGKIVCLASYKPKDLTNYVTVEDIEVEVTVKCPAHQYTSEVTKEPTVTENGEETYTCQHCGDSYIIEISVSSLPKIDGIYVEDISAVFDSMAKRITVEGIQTGDIVQYAGEDKVYGENQPEMINAGVYQVFYKVTRTGCQPFYGTAQVEIEKAVPEYTIPVDLKGDSGTTLESVKLPEGFVWQTEPQTKLYQEGKIVCLASYKPKDLTNYVTVEDIEVEVTVKCPAHQYTSEVTKEPTVTENGEETYTCQLCGDSYTIEVSDSSLPKIDGIYAGNVSAVFDGTAKTITVEGIQTGDIVQYAGEDKVYGENQPEMIHAGTYLVMYKVEREGYQIYYGRANVVIEKAVPEYTIPKDLQGVSGATLESVTLPEGFVWQTDLQTRLYQEGKIVYLAKYIPEDSDNYVAVEKIEIEVTVKCPEHQYTSKVTKEPTAAEKGEETYTCQNCGDTYVKVIESQIQGCSHQYQAVITKNATEISKGLKIYTCSLCKDSYSEEIPMLEPTKPASVTGLKVKKNTAKSLTFSWKKVNGVNYRLVFYKGSKKISTKYLKGNRYTYKKLKAATGYTLKVTPYRVVNGKKVYAIASKQVKTATAPAAVKLSAVKKTGRSSVKLTWKKPTGATGYEIYMKTNKAGYKKIKSIGKAKTVSYVKDGLKKGKTYRFRLRAYKTVNGNKIYGAYSKVKKIKLH